MRFAKKGFILLSSIVLAMVFMFSTMAAYAGGNTWVAKASMANARASHQAVVVNGKIYVIGGGNGISGNLKPIEVYDPATNTWTIKASMATARSNHQVAVVNGKIYAIGGTNESSVLDSVEEYDPSTNTWTTKASMATARFLYAVAVVNGKIYVIGGVADKNVSNYLNSVEEYDPTTNTWTTKASMVTARYWHQVAVVNGKIYAIGGHNGSSSNSINSIEEYDPATNTWTTKASMTTGRYSHRAAVVNGKIYAIGGENGVSALNSVVEYDPATNICTTKASMATVRFWHEIAVVNGKIYAIGGSTDNGSLNSVEEYAPITNTWTTKASMATARYWHQVAVVDDKIYAIGGSDNSVEQYTLGTIPSSPTNLTTTAGNDSVTLSWTAVTGATGYNIKRATTAGGPYTTIESNRTIAAYTDRTVTNGTTYFYVVTSIDPGGESVNSNEVSATPNVPAPSTPTNLTATAGNASVNLSWTAVTGATGYNIKRATTAGGPYTTILSNRTTTSYTDSTVTNGTTYYYFVTAVNSGGESANSNGASATPNVPAPLAPTNLTAIAGNASVNLSWTAVTGATGYNIKRATTAGGPYTTAAENISTTSHTDSTVTNGTTYYYVVTAVGPGGESVNSNEASATPLDPGKALLVITLDNGTEKEYDLSMPEVNAFIDWYDAKAAGTGKSYYVFNKSYNKGPFTARKDYLIFDKIRNFEIMQYE